jgi:quercetin dioxygenase-like cupin family protein
MIIRNVDEVEMEEVEMKGVKGAYIQWMASKNEGAPNFAMRRFKVLPGGSIDLHDHPWEHEIYILNGTGEAFNSTEKKSIRAGDVLFIPGSEPH